MYRDESHEAAEETRHRNRLQLVGTKAELQLESVTVHCECVGGARRHGAHLNLTDFGSSYTRLQSIGRTLFLLKK
jgi:hypothetical protein